MRALHIQKYGRMPSIANIPIPKREKGQYLIRMKYAPVNPSDVFFYLGLYGVKKQGFPIMGFEGSGVIQDCDREQQKGRPISMFANMSNGTYANYMVANPSDVIVWPKKSVLSQEEISMTIVNPLSVLGMVDITERENVQTVVLSAAASNTSRMLMKLIKKNKPDSKVFGMSRSEKYDEELRKIGYDSIFRMEQIQELKNQMKNHGKTVFLDCVSGNYAGQVFNILPSQSLLINYGRLSKERLGSIDSGSLYYGGKRIQGFWLNSYLSQSSNDRIQKIKQEVIDNADLFRQKIRKILPLDSYEQAIKESVKDQSEGKILLDLN